MHMCFKIIYTINSFCCEKTSFDPGTYVNLTVSAMLRQAEQFPRGVLIRDFSKNTASDSNISSEVILAQIFRLVLFPIPFSKS